MAAQSSRAKEFKPDKNQNGARKEYVTKNSGKASFGNPSKASKGKSGSGEKRWQKEKPGIREKTGEPGNSIRSGKRVYGREQTFGVINNQTYSGEKKSDSSRAAFSLCPVFKECGGCHYLDMSYEKQLEKKKKDLQELLSQYCKISGVIGMKNPYHYRNKVHVVFDHDRRGNPFSGVYKANSHEVVPVESCMIEDQKADEIIGTIRGMLKSFKIRTYDEDTGYGLLRHVVIKRGFTTGEIMVVLVTSSPIFPSKKNFVKALLERQPEITTVIQNVNGRDTSMVLGDQEHVMYGKGYIEDILCGKVFRISSKSFYQVNPVQTEVLYKKAMEMAALTGKETVIDAYCGIGTIGITASQKAGVVIGVELNPDAVKDAIQNAKRNQLNNIQFYCNDAGKFMMNMAAAGEQADVVFMDPPRSGSTEEFIDAVTKLKPEKVIYISCNPVTLERDLGLFLRRKYKVVSGVGVDLFPWTNHIETVILMTYCGTDKKNKQ